METKRICKNCTHWSENHYQGRTGSKYGRCDGIDDSVNDLMLEPCRGDITNDVNTEENAFCSMWIIKQK